MKLNETERTWIRKLIKNKDAYFEIKLTLDNSHLEAFLIDEGFKEKLNLKKWKKFWDKKLIKALENESITYKPTHKIYRCNLLPLAETFV